MGIFKLWQGDVYIKKLRLYTNNIKLYLGDKLRYQMPISGATATCSSATYNGSTQIAQNISVVLSGETLTNGVDYSVTSNSGGINAGTYPFTVSGINYFNTSVNGTFTIKPKTVSNPTITLSPASYTYSGNQCKPTPTVKDGSTTIPSGEYTVSYSNNINAGTATCTITDKSGGNYTVSGSKTFTINKVTPTVTPPTAKSLTYNGSAQALVDAGSTNFGTLQYCLNNSGGTYSTSIPSGTNATSYDVWYKVVGDSNINDVAPAKVTVSIAKANPSYTAPTAKSLTYNGNAQTLLNAGAVTGGTIYYSSDNTNWGTTIPSGTNANTYTSYWKITGDSNHNDKASASITTTIKKAAGSVTTAPTKKTLTYNNTDQALVNAGSGTGTMMYKLGSGSWGTSIPTGKAAGNYTVYYKASASTNYEESTSGSVACSIAKVTPTVTAPTAKSLTYTGNAQTLANAGTTNWGTLQYSTASGGTYSTSIPTGTNAGDYEVWYKVVGNSNINDVAPAKIDCSIAKANPTYTAPTKKTGLVYNASAQALLNAGSTSHGTIQYSSNGSAWSDTIPTQTNVGTYSAYWKLDGDSNHNSVGSTKISDIAISKVTPTVTAPTPKTLTFNGANQTLANAGSTNFGSLQYCLNNSGGTYSTTVPSASAANVTYKVWYKVVGDSNINDVAPASIDCMIAEKRVTTPTITLDPASYTYNGTARKPTPTVKDGTTVIPSSEYTVSYSNNTNAGTATVTITDKDAGNYYISGTTTFTINKVTPTVTAPKATTYSYNGAARDLVSGGSTNWGSLQYSTASAGTYSTTIPTQTNAGSYDVWYKVVGDSNINSTNPVKVACSIAKATGTATVAGTTNTYNGSAKSLITVSNNTGTMHYKVDSGGWSTTLPQATNAGSWTIYYYMDASSNYTARGSESSPWGSVSSSIAKANGSVSTKPTAKSLTYNASAQALVNTGSGTGTMMYKLGSGSWGTSIPSATNAGDYTVYYKASASTNYNESASGSVACSIAKVTPTVTPPTAKSLTYTGSAQALVNAGSTNYGTLKYSLDNSTYSTNIPSGTNATSYTVYYRVDGDSNINSVAATSLSVTIAKANPTYTAPAKKTGLVYNGNNQNLLTAGSTSHGTIKYSSDNSNWSTTIPTGKNASTGYTAYWKLEGDSNHKDVASTSITGITIAQKAISIPTPTGVTRDYNGNPATATFGSATGASITKYRHSTNGTSWTETTSNPSQTNAGTLYTQAYYTVNDSNYSGAGWSSSATIKINVLAGSISYGTTSVTKTYGDAAFTNTLTKTGDGTVTYSSNNTTVATVGSDGKVTIKQAGSATITATVANTSNTTYATKTATYTLTVNKASGSVTTKPTAKSLTWNGSAQALVTAGSGTGTMMYKLDSGSWGTSIPSATNATSYTVYYKASASTNYNESSSASTTVTINKKTGCAISFATTSVSKTYGNAAFTNAITNNGDGSVTWGSSNTTIATVNTSGQVTIKQAGSCTISATTTSTTNCTYSTTAASYTLSVAKASISPTVSISNWNYGGTASNPSVNGNTGGGTVTYYYKLSSSSTWSTTKPSNAGSYNIRADIAATTNYASGTCTSNFTINKVAMSYTAPSAATHTYNSSAQQIVSGQSVGGGSIYYATSSAGASSSTTVPTQTNIGTYSTYWKAVPDGNHSGGTSSWAQITNCKINCYTASAPTNKNPNWTGSAQAYANAGSTAYGTMVYCSTSGGTFTTSLPTATNAGSYECWYKVSGNTNVCPQEATKVACTIAKVAMSYTAPSAATRTYTGSAQQIVSGGSATGGAIYYATSSAGASSSTTVPSKTDAGSYTVYWKAVPDGNHSGGTSSWASISCSIGAKTVSSPTITLSQSTYTYANTAFQPTPTVKDGSTTIASSEYTVSYSNNTNVGTATCTITDKSGGNYTVSGSKTFTITCYSATAPTNKNPKWTGSAQAYANAGSTTYGTMVYCKTSGGTFTTSLPTGTNAGSYDLWWKVTGNTNVCNTAATKVACSIAKVAMTYTAPKAATRNYNGSAQQIVSGASAAGGSIYYATSSAGASSSTTVPTQTAAGTYSTYWKAVPDSNHSGGTSSWAQITSCVINKVAMTYTAPKVTTYTYGNTARALVSGASANGGSIQYCATSGGTYSTTVPTQTNAGTYDTWWKAVPDSNHSGGTNAAKLTTTVNCYSATAPTNKNPTYTGSAIAYANAGSTSYGTMVYCNTSGGTFSTSVPTATNAGSYECWWKVTGNTNVCNTAATKVACTIAKAACCSTAPTAKSLTYTGNAQALVNAGSSSCGTMQYCATQTGTYSTTIPTQTAAGTYTTYWKVANDSNHSGTCSGSVSTTIAKAAMTYTAPKAATRTYNSSAQQIVSGQSAGGGSIYYATSSAGASSSTTVPTQTNIGTYSTYWKAVPDSNHSGGTSSWAQITDCKINCYTASAPTNKKPTYNGSAQAYANAGSTTYGTMVYCSTSGGTFSTSVPTATNAGSYECWYKVSGNTNVCPQAATKVACTIAAKTVSSPTITLSPTSYTWNNTERKPTPTVKDGSTTIASSEYTVSYSNNKAAGTATCTITDKSGGNYTVSGSKTFTISKYTPTAPTAKSLTYNGSAQALVNTGSTSFGSIVYSTTSGGTYSTTIPTGTNAGSYEVWWKLSGDSTVTSNCNNTGATKISISIAKAACCSTAPKATTYTYANTARNLVSGGSSSCGTMQYATTQTGTYSGTIPTQTNAGTYTTYWKVSNDSNHSGTCSGSVSTTIAKYTPTAPTNKNPKWTGSAQAYANAGSTTYGTMVYCKTSGGTFTTSLPTETNVGNYDLWWKVTGNTNVNNTAATKVACSIAKKTGCAISFATTSVSKTYGNGAFTNAITNTGDGSLTWGSSNTAIATVNTSGQVTIKAAGSCTISATTTSTTNCTYSTTAASYSLSIAKAAMTYSAPKAAVRTYNGSAQQIVSGQSAAGGSIYYATSSAGASSSTTVPTQTNTGTTYSTYWKAVPDSNHSGGTSSWTQITGCTINKATLTITAKAQTVNYGTAITTGTGQVTTSGLVGGDSLTSITLTQSTTNVPGGTITPSAGATTKGIGNYSVTYKTGTLTINKVAMTYTAPSGATRTYNGSAQQIVSGQSAGGGSIYYATSSGGTGSATTVPTRTNTGSTDTWWKAVPDSNHSGGTSSWAKLTGTINKKALTITAKAQTITWGGSITTGTGQTTTSGLVSGDALTAITLTPSTTAVTTTGTITPSAGATTKGIGNYSVTYKTGTLTINKVAMTYTAPSGATRTYNGSAQQIVSGGSAGGGNIYYATSSAGASSSTTVPTKTDASTGYDVYWKAVPDSNHSGGTSSWDKITGVINKASQSAPTATGATVCYGNTATASASGGGGKGSIKWSNGNSRTAVGSQTTKARWSGNSNYNASSYSSEVTLKVTDTWCSGTTWSNNLTWPSA